MPDFMKALRKNGYCSLGGGLAGAIRVGGNHSALQAGEGRTYYLDSWQGTGRSANLLSG